MKAASSIVLPGAMGPTMLSIQPRSRTFSFGLMLPFYFGCVRLDGVAFTRASIRCKLYGALIVLPALHGPKSFDARKLLLVSEPGLDLRHLLRIDPPLQSRLAARPI